MYALLLSVMFMCRKNLYGFSLLLNVSGHSYIGTEHLLLGLLSEGEGVAAAILESLGADPKNIRTQASLVIISSVCFAPYILFDS